MTTADISALRRLLVYRANQLLDDMQRRQADLPPEEWEYPGGICHLVADLIADVLISEGIDAVVADTETGVAHTYVIARGMAGDAVLVDIPYTVYEVYEGPYTFELRPHATISPEDLVIEPQGRPF